MFDIYIHLIYLSIYIYIFPITWGLVLPPLRPLDQQAASADALAICSGEDRRLVVLPSFGSLGIMHHWMLLKVGP